MKKSVLVVATTPLCVDGLTRVLIIISKFIQGQFEVSFALGEGCERNVFEQISALGTIHELPSRKKATVRYYLALSYLVQREHYDIVHIHGNSQTMALDLIATRKVPNKITHCHNWSRQPMLKKMTLGIVLNRLVTHPLACSFEAGKAIYTKPFTVIHNGIDLDRFQYSEKKRVEMRSSMGLNGHFVLGHIGRFSEQKNHVRLLSIFQAVLQIDPNAILLLIGTGELQEKIKEKANGLNLADSIRFCGVVDNPQDYMMAMDTFVLPSLFEGLPLVGVEAQATGLPCIFADSITREAAIIDCVEFVSLEDGDQVWAEKICAKRKTNRLHARSKVDKAGYGLEYLRDQIKTVYEQL